MTMKAVGYQKSLPITEPASLQDIHLPEPALAPRDLLVEVRAVSVNPVDTKVRMKAEPEEGYKVLGFDAAGVVRSVGSEVTLFRPGDAVFYAGDITRPGSNAELQLVDERIVGRKPESLSFADAAALPLTAITAWELLFDGFRLSEQGGAGDTLLIIGGAGGVGSIMTQLAKQLTGLTVVSTASRQDTRDWCLRMGADHVVNHRKPLAAQLEALGLSPRYVASLTASGQHFKAIVELIAPRGQIGMIDDPQGVDIGLMKQKALSFHWEFMFTRPMFQTADMIVQHELLNRVADLVDRGQVRTTANHHAGRINAQNLRAAHELQESGMAIGKTVLEGF